MRVPCESLAKENKNLEQTTEEHETKDEMNRWMSGQMNGYMDG